MGLFWQQSSPDAAWVVVIEETDEKVCYGYLVRGPVEKGAESPIVADVWLYNLVPAPEIPEWTLPDATGRLPFLNPAAFVDNDGRLQNVEPDQLNVRWSHDERSVVADIYLVNAHLARLKPGVTPGWSMLARRPNAIALPLSDA